MDAYQPVASVKCPLLGLTHKAQLTGVERLGMREWKPCQAGLCKDPVRDRRLPFQDAEVSHWVREMRRGGKGHTLWCLVSHFTQFGFYVGQNG